MVTVTAALSVLAPLPGTATEARAAGGKGADIPAYAVSDDAKPVKGTANSSDGPSIEPGLYKDSIRRGEKKYYSVSLDAKSSAYFSAVAAPTPGTKVSSYADGLEISLRTVDGDECGNGPMTSDFAGYTHGYPISADVARTTGTPDDECAGKGPYLLSVSRKGAGTSSPEKWPLELSYMEEPPLKSGEQTGAPDESEPSDDVPVPSVQGEKKKASGGTGFNDAGSVGPGLWKDRIKPGETRFYRVPVDWGQQLHASVELGSSGRGGKFPPTVFQALGVVPYGPARQRIDRPEYANYTDESAAVPFRTPKVGYGNRSGDEARTRAAAAAGWQYIEVTASPQLAEKYFSDRAAALTLRIDIKGKAQPGPAYDGDAKAAGFGVSDDDREAARTGRNALQTADDDSGTLRILGLAGVGAGSALLVLLAVWLIVARRRAAAVPVVPGAAAPPFQPYGYADRLPPQQGAPGSPYGGQDMYGPSQRQ